MVVEGGSGSVVGRPDEFLFYLGSVVRMVETVPGDQAAAEKGSHDIRILVLEYVSSVMAVLVVDIGTYREHVSPAQYVVVVQFHERVAVTADLGVEADRPFVARGDDQIDRRGVRIGRNGFDTHVRYVVPRANQSPVPYDRGCVEDISRPDEQVLAYLAFAGKPVDGVDFPLAPSLGIAVEDVVADDDDLPDRFPVVPAEILHIFPGGFQLGLSVAFRSRNRVLYQSGQSAPFLFVGDGVGCRRHIRPAVRPGVRAKQQDSQYDRSEFPHRTQSTL